MRVRAVFVMAWTCAVLVPLVLAWDQLDSVAERSIWQTLSSFEDKFQTKGAIGFTFKVAALSTLVTLVVGVPLAWNLGRYRWPGHAFLRGLFTVPFVMPSILVAMGFLALFDAWPIMRREGAIWALLIAHAWFNLALVVRFCEPLLATLDPELEEAARLLPHGETRWQRMRNLWAPLMWPSVAAAGAMTFLFSFTSFALVRWLTPGQRNLEVVMANQSDWAGIQIPELGRAPSEIVMAASMVQMLTILASLALISWLQSKRMRMVTPTIEDARTRGTTGWAVHLMLMAGFVLAPLVALTFSSFQIRGEWSLAGWEAAFAGSRTGIGVSEALRSSIGYALLTLAIALPLGYILADTIQRVEQTRPRLAMVIDVLAMLPLAISAVIIGLGVLIGLLRTEPALLREWWIPAYGHVMLTTPFVVRILLPAMRGLDPDFENSAALLGARPFRRLVSIRLPLLRGSLIVAGCFVLAISLGEFGASWVVIRFTEWTTLPVLIDELLGRPGFDPVPRAAAHAGGVVLLGLTMVLFMAVERFRPLGRGGDF